MKTLLIYLDDLRPMPKSYLSANCELRVCKNYQSAVAAIYEHFNHFENDLIVDLDHDLGEFKTGYDFCKFLVSNGITGKFHIHSMNPVGRENMQQLLSHFGWEEI